MAGWNLHRLQGNTRFRNLPVNEHCAELDPAILREVAPTLGDMMARVGRDLLRQRWRTTPDPARPIGGVPHLVAGNGSPELQLSRIVEFEIIPRLMLLHGDVAAPRAPSRQDFSITAAHVETLAHVAVVGDPERTAQFVQALIAAGAPLEQVFLQLLSPAAKLMGEFWIDDVYSFSEVTIGLWRLQQVLHEHSSGFRLGAASMQGRRALLAAEPGSQHTFGVAMLSEFFARDGWFVQYEPKSDWADLQDAVSSDWYDMFGMSVGVDMSVPTLASAILELRRASRNPKLFVMVGGPAMALIPDLSERCGADAMATDATSAVATANQWLGSMRQER
ncbi:cobalamin B12-binding domain-containing protein [Sphaerotilus mobilis]|nr:cobalamin B12-binding domain-containing protein [Sphaerotilus mobilis]